MAQPAAAHGFGQRFDLPLPLWLWVAGAGATIVLTFAAMALFFREDRAAGYPSLALFRVPRALIAVARIAALLLLVLTICGGFFGAQDPYRNLITTMIWIVWWVGFAFVCALAGDLWALVNPLRLRMPSLALRYPAWLGAWPAVVLLFAFAWAELVWRDNDVPAYLACAVLGYAVLAWGGTMLFGAEQWLRSGEAFSLVFGVLGRFAPLYAQGGVLRLRPPGAGLMTGEPVHVSLAVFVLLMLATVTFDGFLETPLMRSIETALHGSALLFRLSEWGLDEAQLVASVALLVFPLGFCAAYWLTAWAMVRVSNRSVAVAAAACAFVFTLVPIAVAYHLAHYFSLLLTAGQFIVPLASDPFGFGWDLFGTAGYKVDLGIVSPYVFWYGAVTLIVAGHVIAVILAHSAALRVFGAPGAALASQIPMVLLMVAYTMLSLWILAQPVVG